MNKSIVKRSKAPQKSVTKPGKRPASPRPKAMPRLSAPSKRLAPGDPQATNTATLPGAGAVGNTILTDTNYTMGTEDQTVIVVQNGATVTLAEEPLLGYPVYVIADGGVVLVEGPIQGGTQTLLQGTIGVFAYSTSSGMWSKRSSESMYPRKLTRRSSWRGTSGF